ncbi:hypothetical protein [uncultured Methanoregula sp.]|uniref:hypothetical protein n=1 Tax=uncultured Methanoregula sp. TaxID=1005933 RepID=UPI002AAB9062|nr:hypothetical protein [uncultured Methanoregula sp.]
MAGNPGREDAFTGLEVVILIIVLLVIAGGFFLFMTSGETPGWARTFPGGMVADSVYVSGDHMQPVGSVVGFPAVSRINNKPLFLVPRGDPKRLGAIQVMVSLFIGHTGAIDMDQVHVSWTGDGFSEQIPKTNILPLVCPNWTITGKYNMLPGHVADADNWMEPDEEFEILVCSSRGVRPYESFTVTLRPEGTAMPLPLARTAPARIEPVMKLG